jgi:hypothetical protein
MPSAVVSNDAMRSSRKRIVRVPSPSSSLRSSSTPLWR